MNCIGLRSSRDIFEAFLGRYRLLGGDRELILANTYWENWTCKNGFFRKDF